MGDDEPETLSANPFKTRIETNIFQDDFEEDFQPLSANPFKTRIETGSITEER